MENKKDSLFVRGGVVRGRVQGVGFRWFASRTAEEIGVSGWVRNLDNGDVEFLAQGEQEKVEAFIARLREGPGYADVTDVTVREEYPDASLDRFEIRH